jgi:hypothetical protein
MAAVHFTFGGKPGLTSDAVAFVAGLLEARATPGALELGTELRGYAEAEHLFERVTLTEPQMAELLAALSDASRLNSESLHRLRSELETALHRH